MLSNRHDEFMRRAIELARIHSFAGEGGPFGAVIVADGAILAEGWNRVLSTNDPTAHAEIVAIRRAAELRADPALRGCAIYSSCEPCPMCFGAIRWARLDALYFAADRRDASEIGFDDSTIYEEIARAPEDRTLRTTRILRAEARAAMDEWNAIPGREVY